VGVNLHPRGEQFPFEQTEKAVGIIEGAKYHIIVGHKSAKSAKSTKSAKNFI